MRHGSAQQGGADTTTDTDDPGWNNGPYRSGDGTPTVPRQQSASDRGHRARSSRPVPTRRRKKGKRKVFRYVAITTSLLILGTAGAGWAYYQHLNGNLKKDALNLGSSSAEKSKANAAGQTPLNILLLGSDSRASKANQHLGGAKADATRAPLADVEMLVHVSADRGNMTVMSVPRDTRVEIPQCRGQDGTVYPATTSQTINTSLQHGGPGCTVATWEKLTGAAIDHFMMIDFAGVVSMADAVGGVPVCVNNNIYDKQSGIRLTKGNHTIQGQQALQWLRTRHGFEDGSDIGRTHAQHMYMNAMVRQLKSGAKLTDPSKLLSLAESATKALTVDNGLGSVNKLASLATDLGKVPTDRITMTTMPWGPDPQDPTAHIVPTSAAGKLFTLIRNDAAVDGKSSTKTHQKGDASPTTAATASPKADIAVTVQNGTGSASVAAVSGRASAIATQLNGLGYTKATADTTAESQSGTTISYPSDSLKANAQAVAKSLNLPAGAVKKATALSQITLLIGSDWTTGTSYPKSSSADTKAVLDNSAALNASDTSACMKVNPYYIW
jgi:LCP family protein required for cell wall assembly